MNSEDYEKYFGKEYFEKGAIKQVGNYPVVSLGRSGGYTWENKGQQAGLKFRYDFIRVWAPGEWRKILVVGCGKGFLVKYFRDKGYDAYGTDISNYAVENCHPDVKDYVFREDACDMKRFKENEFDIVVSWSMLPMVDRNRRKEAVKNMIQLTSRYLILTFGVEGIRTAKKTEPDGYDGGPVYLEPLYYWIQLVERFNKFRLRMAVCTGPFLSQACQVYWRKERNEFVG